MKKFKNILFVGILSLLSLGCEENENLQPTEEFALTAPDIVNSGTTGAVVLNADNPQQKVQFEWTSATNTRSFLITYRFLLDQMQGDFSAPLYVAATAENGTALSAEITHQQMDKILQDLGYGLNETVTLKWAVEATAQNKKELTGQNIEVTRFVRNIIPETLFISGEGVEAGPDLANATPMILLATAAGKSTDIFEVYTTLEAGKPFKFYADKGDASISFGGNSGELVNKGSAINAPESGQYRVRANFIENKYEFLKIDRWSIVGNVIQGGWGGDTPLNYQGNGVWSATIALQDADAGDTDKRFVFRANGDWGLVYKKVTSTDNRLVFESFGQSNGYTPQDIAVAELATYKITLSLTAPQPSFSIEEPQQIATIPDALFLFADGTLVTELQKTADTFSYQFVDMAPGVNYTLNSKSDNSGDAYSIGGALGNAAATDDKVIGSVSLQIGAGAFTVTQSQAYALNLDFATESANWSYYNFKLFHWSPEPDGWEAREEIPMTYQGNYVWTVSNALQSGYNSKFISPWDFQLGAENANELIGVLSVNGENNDINNLAEDGTYAVNFTLNSDFSEGTYEFVKQ